VDIAAIADKAGTLDAATRKVAEFGSAKTLAAALGRIL
jgi:hypothetical protein